MHKNTKKSIGNALCLPHKWLITKMLKMLKMLDEDIEERKNPKESCTSWRYRYLQSRNQRNTYFPYTAAIASLAHGTLSGRGYLREVSFEALLQCVMLLFIEATRKKRPGAGRPACHSTVSGGESNKPLAQQDRIQPAHVTQNDEHCRQTHTDEHGQSGDWHGLTEQIHSATPTTCRKKYCCVKYRNEVTQQLTLSNLFTRKIQFYMIRNDCRIRHKNDIVCRFAWMVQCLNRLTPCMKKATREPQNQVRKLRQLIKSRARTRRTDLTATKTMRKICKVSSAEHV